MMKTVSYIDIAKLAAMQLANREVLPDKVQTAERKHQLLCAMLLYLGEHQAVNICFKNSDGMPVRKTSNKERVTA